MAVAFQTLSPRNNQDPKNPPVDDLDRPFHPHEAEAPDRGDEALEAPETHLSDSMEAPDAGEGRSGYFESEFTHGRSQS